MIKFGEQVDFITKLLINFSYEQLACFTKFIKWNYVTRINIVVEVVQEKNNYWEDVFSEDGTLEKLVMCHVVRWIWMNCPINEMSSEVRFCKSLQVNTVAQSGFQSFSMDDFKFAIGYWKTHQKFTFPIEILQPIFSYLFNGRFRNIKERRMKCWNRPLEKFKGLFRLEEWFTFADLSL